LNQKYSIKEEELDEACSTPGRDMRVGLLWEYLKEDYLKDLDINEHKNLTYAYSVGYSEIMDLTTQRVYHRNSYFVKCFKRKLCIARYLYECV
jgi:hypothetical protein